jgi:hypothetical protein
MKRSLGGIIFAVALVACNEASPVPAASGRVGPTMLATSWAIQYSPGMPAHPLTEGGGWYFEFPDASGSVHYVTTAVNILATKAVSASIAVATTGAPTFNYKLSADNVCDYPAHVRLYLQRRGDDWTGRGPMQYYRWFSNQDQSGAFLLAQGHATLSASLTDPAQWTSVFGKRGDADAEARTGFHQAIADIDSVGFTFGGGCFYGHGVNVVGGTARFVASSYTVD